VESVGARILIESLSAFGRVVGERVK